VLIWRIWRIMVLGGAGGSRPARRGCWSLGGGGPGNPFARIRPATARPVGAVITWLGRTGRDDARPCSLQLIVTPPKEVRPMNAVSMLVLPLPVTVGRLT
jgi:hypothetical protein